MSPLGSPAPDFALRNVDGRLLSLRDFADAPALLVMFICNHCPYVKHVAPALANLGRQYQAQGVAVVAINSNDPAAYPQDSPEQMVQEVEQRGYTFPYLFDETQEVAKAYGAACTPDFFLYDRNRRLVYRGQLDSSRPNSNIPVTGADLTAAVNAVWAGQPVAEQQRARLGWNIKWKSGGEPGLLQPARHPPSP
jgi:peroxiredoxin